MTHNYVVTYVHISYIYCTHTDICDHIISVFRVGMLLVGACPAGWWFYDRTFACFYLSTVTLSQTDAYAECQSMGAELASFSNQAEMDFVTSVSSVPSSFSISHIISDKQAIKQQ